MHKIETEDNKKDQDLILYLKTTKNYYIFNLKDITNYGYSHNQIIINHVVINSNYLKYRFSTDKNYMSLGSHDSFISKLNKLIEQK